MVTKDPTITESQAKQLEHALASIENLQHQLDQLRSAIPAMVQPLASNRSGNKAQIARDVRSSATTTMSQIKKLREDWTSQQTQSILAQAAQSGSKDPDVSMASNVPAWGWSDTR